MFGYRNLVVFFNLIQVPAGFLLLLLLIMIFFKSEVLSRFYSLLL